MKLKLFVLFVSLLSINGLNAQWVQTAGPTGVSVLALAASDDGAGNASLLAGTPGGAFLSTDAGSNWTPANSGLTDLYITSLAVTSNGEGGTNIFAGTHGGIFGVSLSPPSPTIWTAVNNGLWSPVITSFVVFPGGTDGTELFASTTAGVFLSTNSGAQWTAVNQGLTSTFVYVLSNFGSILFAGTKAGGAFRSTDSGASWTAANNGLTKLNVVSLAVAGGNLFAGTLSGGVFVSKDTGASWTSYHGLSNFFSLVNDGPNLFAGTSVGVFLSKDQGATWTAVNSSLTDSVVYSLAVSGGNLFAGTDSSGVWSRPLLQMTASVENVQDNLPAGFSLDQNYPNPFNPSTTIRYVLPVRSSVRLQVFDILGQTVAVLANGEQSAGTRLIEWNAGVSSGMYFYRIEANPIEKSIAPFVKVRKLVVLK